MSDNGGISKALVAFQKEAPSLPLDGKNPHFNNKFTTLLTLMDRVRPVLAKNGLALVQFPTVVWTEQGPQPALRTRLVHESGEFLEDTMLLEGKRDPQGQGSGITYARRYAGMAVLGLVGDEDDDGNAATAAKGSSPTEAVSARTSDADGAPASTPPAVPMATDEQREEIVVLIAECAPLADLTVAQITAGLEGKNGPLTELTRDAAKDLIPKLKRHKTNLAKAKEKAEAEAEADAAKAAAEEESPV